LEVSAIVKQFFVEDEILSQLFILKEKQLKE